MSFLDSIQSTLNNGISNVSSSSAVFALKNKNTDLLKQREALLSQLGSALYDATKENKEFREPNEALYSQIEEIDHMRADVAEQIQQLENQAAKPNVDSSAAQAGTTTCPNCGAAVPSGNQFCGSCGQKIPPVVMAPTCSQCGAPYEEGSVFCISCGAKIEPQSKANEETLDQSAIETISPDEPSENKDSPETDEMIIDPSENLGTMKTQMIGFAPSEQEDKPDNEDDDNLPENPESSNTSSTTDSPSTEASSLDFCKSCGASLDEGDIFCSSCGAAVDTSQQSGAQDSICVSCGYENSPDSLFCLNCGTKLK